MRGSSNTRNGGGCQWAIHTVAWVVCTFAASIYMHSKLPATQFKHLPDVVMLSPGHYVTMGGGQPSDQRGQGLWEGGEGMQLTACWQRGSMGGVMMEGGDREKTPSILFFQQQVSLARWILCFLAFGSSPGTDFA